jgi:hypothetical protein
MDKKERKEYHKKWRDNHPNREQWLADQRRRHRKWYYGNLEHAREVGRDNAKRWRDPNMPKVLGANESRRQKAAARNTRFINAYKSTIGCIDCGQNNPIVLDFDHQRDKRLRVSTMRASGWTLLTIVKEIEKCELRCANCHRIRHCK